MSGSPLASVAVKLLTITPAPSTLPMAKAVAMGAVLGTTVGTVSSVASVALAAATPDVVSVSLSSAVVPNVKLRSFRTSLTLDKSTKLEPLLLSCRICPAAVSSITSLMSLPLSMALITVSIVA